MGGREGRAFAVMGVTLPLLCGFIQARIRNSQGSLLSQSFGQAQIPLLCSPWSFGQKRQDAERNPLRQ